MGVSLERRLGPSQGLAESLGHHRLTRNCIQGSWQWLNALMVGFTALMRGTYSTPKTVIGNGTKREESEDPLVSFAMKVSYWTASQ